MKLSTKDRFYSKVDKTAANGCWIFLGAKSRWGYGRFLYKNKNQPAHRVSYILEKGEIPKSLYVLHKCDNPPCVNPSHLFLGTPAQNVADMMSKNRATRKFGESNINAKLNTADVLEIRRLLSNGVKVREIMKKYDISYAHVYAIKAKKRWSHI